MKEDAADNGLEPQPAGSRAQPPRLPPAPPALGEQPSPSGSSVPASVQNLLRAFHGCLRDAGELRLLLRPNLPGAGLPEVRTRLLDRILELRGLLLLGDEELPDDLLLRFQHELLGLCASTAPQHRGYGHLSPSFRSAVIQRALGMEEEPPWEWRQFPLPSEPALMQWLELPPRAFFRRTLEALEARVTDPGSYEDPTRFDQAVSRRMVAAFAAALAVVDWVRDQSVRG